MVRADSKGREPCFKNDTSTIKGCVHLEGALDSVPLWKMSQLSGHSLRSKNIIQDPIVDWYQLSNYDGLIKEIEVDSSLEQAPRSGVSPFSDEMEKEIIHHFNVRKNWLV